MLKSTLKQQAEEATKAKNEALSQLEYERSSRIAWEKMESVSQAGKIFTALDAVLEIRELHRESIDSQGHSVCVECSSPSVWARFPCASRRIADQVFASNTPGKDK